MLLIFAKMKIIPYQCTVMENISIVMILSQDAAPSEASFSTATGDYSQQQCILAKKY